MGADKSQKEMIVAAIKRSTRGRSVRLRFGQERRGNGSRCIIFHTLRDILSCLSCLSQHSRGSSSSSTSFYIPSSFPSELRCCQNSYADEGKFIFDARGRIKLGLENQSRELNRNRARHELYSLLFHNSRLLKISNFTTILPQYGC